MEYKKYRMPMSLWDGPLRSALESLKALSASGAGSPALTRGTPSGDGAMETALGAEKLHFQTLFSLPPSAVIPETHSESFHFFSYQGKVPGGVS